MALTMIRAVLDYGFAALAALCFLAFILLGAALPQYLDPARSMDDKLTTFFTPSRRRTDFVDPGWRLQKLQWLCMALAVLFFLIWAITSPAAR
jgi:hypothetical protein